jgi:hypothetical protein
MRRRPKLWGRLLESLPILVLLYAYCAWSEMLGYVLGPGTSREEFRARELSVSRDAS